MSLQKEEMSHYNKITRWQSYATVRILELVFKNTHKDINGNIYFLGWGYIYVFIHPFL